MAKARLVNIYCQHTDNRKAEAVSLKKWCTETNHDYRSMRETAAADRSKPSVRDNPHHHKFRYARYVDEDTQPAGGWITDDMIQWME